MDMGAVIGAGFRLIRERTGAVAIWAIIYVALSIATGLILMPVLQSIIAAAKSGGDTSGILGSFGAIYAANLATLLVMLIINNAIFRAVLRPQESAFGYLRIGGDELRVVALGLLFGIATFAIFTVTTFAFVGLGMLHRSSGNPFGNVALFGLIGLILLLLGIFIAVRLALVFPLTVMRRKIIIGDAWRYSRGHFWAMFGSFIVVAVIYLALQIAVSAIAGGGSLAMMGAMLNPEKANSLAEAQITRQASGVTLMIALGWVLSGLVGTLWLLLAGGGLATAARQIAPDSAAELEEVWR